MIRGLLLGLFLALPAVAETVAVSVAETVAEAATRASADLQTAVTALEAATTARDRIEALSRTIRAYEAGLAALRGALRDAAVREATLTRRFDAQRDSIGRLLGVLATMEANSGQLLLLHPEGALATARSGMVMAAGSGSRSAAAQSRTSGTGRSAPVAAFGWRNAGRGSGRSSDGPDRTVAGDVGPEGPAAPVSRRSRDAAQPFGQRRHAGCLCRRSDAGSGRRDGLFHRKGFAGPAGPRPVAAPPVPHAPVPGG